MTLEKYRDVLMYTTGSVVAIGVLSILAYLVWAMINHEVPDANKTALLVIAGSVTANSGQVVSFFFSSSSSARKAADTINTLANTASAAQTALTPNATAVPLAPGETVTVKADETKP